MGISNENTEIPPKDKFNIQILVQKLLDKIRTNHPAIRILIVSWIKFLDSIPEIKLINRIFEFLPGLFNMLCDKTKDVNQTADQCLKIFLKEIEKIFENCDKETTNKIIEIIIDQCKNKPDTAVIVAFDWLITFLNKYNNLLNKISFKNIKYHTKIYKKSIVLNNTDKRISNMNMTSRSRIINSQEEDKDRRLIGGSVIDNKRNFKNKKSLKKNVLFRDTINIKIEGEVKSDDENLKNFKKINQDDDRLEDINEKEFKTISNTGKASLDNQLIKKESN